jgi:hypothetical protein
LLNNPKAYCATKSTSKKLFTLSSYVECSLIIFSNVLQQTFYTLSIFIKIIISLYYFNFFSLSSSLPSTHPHQTHLKPSNQHHSKIKYKVTNNTPKTQQFTPKSTKIILNPPVEIQPTTQQTHLYKPISISFPISSFMSGEITAPSWPRSAPLHHGPRSVLHGSTIPCEEQYSK